MSPFDDTPQRRGSGSYKWAGFSAEYRPDPERHAIYDRLYARYLQLGNTR